MTNARVLDRQFADFYATPDRRDVIEICEYIPLQNAHANIIAECKREIIFRLFRIPFPNATYAGLLHHQGKKCDDEVLAFETKDLVIGDLFFRLSTARKNKTCWGGNETVAIFEPRLVDVSLYNPQFDFNPVELDGIPEIDDPKDGELPVLHRAMIGSARIKGYLPDETYINQLIYPTLIGQEYEFPPNDMKRGIWGKPALLE